MEYPKGVANNGGPFVCMNRHRYLRYKVKGMNNNTPNAFLESTRMLIQELAAGDYAGVQFTIEGETTTIYLWPPVDAKPYSLRIEALGIELRQDQQHTVGHTVKTSIAFKAYAELVAKGWKPDSNLSVIDAA